VTPHALPPFLQERWEAEQLKRTKLGASKASAGAQVGGQQYDLVLEDQIDFIRDAVIKGDIDPVSCLVLGMVLGMAMWLWVPAATCHLPPAT
jgi:hypothetical protein